VVSKLGVDKSSAMSAASVATTLRQTRKIVPPTLCAKVVCNVRSTTRKERPPVHPSSGTSLKTLTMCNRAMAISQRTRPTSKTSSSITVTTSAAPLISPMPRPTSPSSMPTCLWANCSWTNTVARICRPS